MNKRWFVAGLFVCALLLAFVWPAQAGGILGASPAEGTLGSIITIAGAGFGNKQGEVLIGEEKCRVLDWSDGQITCLIEKPQPTGEYTLTVLAQGDKKPAQSMTYTPFTMRAPQIIPADTPSGLLWDGTAVTIQGAFFGDKKGEVYIVHREGEIMVESAKVLDWSMDSIRFAIPKKLEPAYTTYILAVKNAVGLDYRVIELAPDEPPMLGSPPGIGGEPVDANSSGIYFNGKFYIFSVKWACGLICGDAHRIQMRTLTNGQLSAFLPIPNTQTNAAVVPMVVNDKLWVFYTGQSGKLWYNIYDGSAWAVSNGWIQIPNVSTRNDWEIAAVFNPLLHRIIVYHEYQDYLNMVYTDNYGADWIDMGKVVGFGTISTPPGAMIYPETPAFYKVMLAVGDSTPALVKAHQGHVYQSYDGGGFSKVLDIGPVWGRPFLMDLSADSIALIYVKDWCYYAATALYDGDPQIRKMNKVTRQWQAPITPLPVAYESWYPPSGAVNPLDGKFYLFWSTINYSTELKDWWMTAIPNLLP